MIQYTNVYVCPSIYFFFNRSYTFSKLILAKEMFVSYLNMISALNGSKFAIIFKMMGLSVCYIEFIDCNDFMNKMPDRMLVYLCTIVSPNLHVAF